MYRNDNCFGCGSDNPMGLHLKVQQQDGGKVLARFVCESKHAGWPGVQHGGVTSALLDEVSGYVPNFMGVMTMTAELKVSYRDPIHVGEHLEIRAEPLRVTRRLIEVTARIVNEQGAVKAESLAKLVVLTEEQRRAAGLTNVAWHKCKKSVSKGQPGPQSGRQAPVLAPLGGEALFAYMR